MFVRQPEVPDLYGLCLGKLRDLYRETLKQVVFFTDNLGVLGNKMAENNEKETQSFYSEGQPLSDFLLQLEDYTPTVIVLFLFNIYVCIYVCVLYT